ncbi:MAG TPA: glycosyl hydrolase 115 family protein [Acidobacteriaceae bacterium]|nr:glycosyl hydrolase 115 family protein [Acidobacteriaceae bacterium]
MLILRHAFRSRGILRNFFLPVLVLFAFGSSAFALGNTNYVESTPSPGSFPIVQHSTASSLYVDAGDFWGVIRAAGDLQSDIRRVTGREPLLTHSDKFPAEVILIATLGKSPVLDRLIQEQKIDVAPIRGKWEATLIQVVPHPFPGVRSALVIAGSDMRGTIYGIYDVSEEIGVSPWYWWADVPIAHQNALFVKQGRFVTGEAAVKYRGIFLNDEAPSLTNWVNQKYGGFNHLFYEKVFELLLRLKANYLWPAMWNSAFNEDDPLDPKLANDYGIVMGTSHHEPMLRAQQEWKRHGTGPWNYETNAEELNRFWTEGIVRNRDYESTITIGMRGDGDMPMSETDNVSLLEKIVADQRHILASHITPTLSSDPQVWALYKEVQGYYEKGMRVPDDVTLLWCDDNWGNIRRLPTAQERKRSGGAGIYYHFDYVGDPRSYKWLNTYSITKVWEQMHLAYAYGADRIWVVNVGDLKPMEFPISFFLDYARNPQRWNRKNLQEFTQLWAAQQFGPQHAAEIADVIAKYTKYNARRKPEQLEPNTFSLTHYQEAARVLRDWQRLTAQAEKLSKELPVADRDAYFELVLYPVKASAIVNEMYITAGKNRLYATQGRVSANDLAHQTRALFQADAAMTYAYNHTLANGKWSHMMDQTHIGYTFWNQPPLNAMPAVSQVQPELGAHMAVAVEGSRAASDNMSVPLTLPTFDSFNRQTEWIEVFNRGNASFTYTVSASQPWIVAAQSHGAVDKQERLPVHIDWDKAPAGNSTGTLEIKQSGGPSVRVLVHAFHPSVPSRSSLEGFVEARHYVSIEAAHTTARTRSGVVHWANIPNFGETLSGMAVFPVTATSVLPPQPAPSLQYKMYLFEAGTFRVEAVLAPTLGFVPGRGLRYAISFDDQPPQVIDALAHNSDKAWATAVSDGVRKVTSTLNVVSPGYHTLKFWMVDPAVVVEKIVVSQEKLPSSYLGPPESYHGTGVAE